MSILKPDPYEDFYAAHKQVHPDDRLEVRAFNRRLVEQVDAIVELAHGERDFISSESDWQIAEKLVDFWAREWPQEFAEFKSAIPEIRESKRDGGYSETGEIQHVGSMPGRLMSLIKAIYPLQQWDKKFTTKFMKRFKLFKVAGESNNGGGRIQL